MAFLIDKLISIWFVIITQYSKLFITVLSSQSMIVLYVLFNEHYDIKLVN